jgi:hypothetical protein
MLNAKHLPRTDCAFPREAHFMPFLVLPSADAAGLLRLGRTLHFFVCACSALGLLDSPASMSSTAANIDPAVGF